MATEDMKCKKHIDYVVNKANRKPVLLKRTFESIDPSLWKELTLN